MDFCTPGVCFPYHLWSLPRFMSIALLMPSSHLILWCPLLFCSQSFPASGTFPMSKLFRSDDQNTGTSASASVLPASIQGWFPLGLTGLISLLSKGLSGVIQLHMSKASILECSAFFTVQLSQLYVTTGKTIALTIQTFVSRVMSLLFNNILSRFSLFFHQKAIVFWFHGCSHCLQWFWSPRRENLSLLPPFSFLFAMQ